MSKKQQLEIMLLFASGLAITWHRMTMLSMGAALKNICSRSNVEGFIKKVSTRF